ncbi:amino acid adenylation domain-containing protein [Actinoplanes sp. NPDC051346]|uniref:amino acid adenylation domain-containing protein n=1 Tax=Actinoplanes sp. NPDC051346 TaxID=3155048 RepID=UPI00343F90B9
MTVLLPEIVWRQVRYCPHAPAIISGDTVLSYRELGERASRIAYGLQGRGIGPETVVGVLMRPGPDLVPALLGVWLSGAAYLPLDPLHPSERLRRIVALAGPDAVLADPGWSASDLAVAPGTWVGTAGDLARERHPAIPPAITTAARQAAYLIFTSGSTGEPKGVVIEHASLANRVLWAVRTLGLSPQDRLLQKTALTFDAAQWEIFAPLACGAPVVLADIQAARDAGSLVRAIQRERATVVQVVPSMLRLLAAESDLGSCDSLRMICAGGEPLRAELCQQVLRLVNVDIWNTYGPTECTIDVTAARFDRAQTTGGVPIGQPIDGNTCLLLGPDGAPAEPGAVAELHVGGIGVGRGYHRNPALTADRFRPDPSGPPGARMYRTGDLVRRRADGVLEYAGRVDAQMKINGVRIEPAEVEAAVLEHQHVVDAAVRSATDPRGAARLVAFVVVDLPGGADDLLAFLRRRLPAALVPSLVQETTALPRTTSGKLDRTRLPEPDWSVASHAASTEPESAEQRVVREVWRELLGLEDIGLDDDFFRIGGHSLLMTRLAPRLTQYTGLSVDLRQLYQSMTVRTQAALLSASMADRPVPRRPVGTRGIPGPVQERFWLMDRLRPGGPEYLLPAVIRLPAETSTDTVDRALTALVERHELLRSRYLMDDAGLRVVVDPPAPVSLGTVRAAPESVGKVLAGELADGFDLAVGPPWRATLVRTGGPDLLLLIVCHHIVSDGWSTGILHRDIRELVAADIGGRSPRLPDLQLSYLDLVAWQREQDHGSSYAGQLAYWSRHLADLPPLELPAARPRPSHRDIAGSTVDFALPAATWAVLSEVGRRLGATPFMTLLTLWKLTLGRAAGQWDFGVGTPYAGRGRPESHHIVGPLLNTIVIRARLNPGLTFAEAVTAVQRTCLEAFANQSVPFDAVVEASGVGRDPSRTPLFQTLFTVVDGLLGAEPHDDDVALLRQAWSVARTDLALTMWRHPDGRFGGALEYASALYQPAAMKELSMQFQQLAHDCADQPDTPVGDLGTARYQDVILGMMNDLLTDGQVGPTQNFFESGGNSLGAARLLWNVQNTFGVEVPMRAMFDNPTAAGLAAAVTDLMPGPAMGEENR